ncbi:calmodulin-like [Ostrea edulis]|uniref:calmodulin-like n=1 Tax=Ostrea edulis TaxID=37623 RepID=UPI0024AEC522|nr:calmodulin-like [Ostrea edulis]
MTCLTKDQYKEIKASFRSMDTNGDGRLSVKEFRDAAKKLGQDVTTAQVKEMFKLVDEDGDDYLSYKEYEKMMVEQLEAQMVELQFLQSCFEKMDVNGDGSITAKEIAKTMGITRAEADELVTEGDTNGDGELTFDEFAAVYRSKDS